MLSRTPLIERLAAEIGRDIYMDVAKWHLYLGDAKLATPLAEAFLPLLEQGEMSSAQVTSVLQEVSVPLGGGQQFLSLERLIPKANQELLVELLNRFRQEELES
ncbi:hypothetical protein NIES2134_116410 [Thermostichus vulcanus NIES-2134]|nr:hypothetical protein NIES2134_116410 [Thermostichus vulcanus NIES-2134]